MPVSDIVRFQDRLQTAIAKSSAVFQKHHVAHALIGGLAVGLRSRPRATMDVDFLVSIPQLNLAAVLNDFVAEGFTPSAVEVIPEWVQHHFAVLWYEDVRVDWLKPVLPLYQHIIDRSEPLRLADYPFHVATVEGLILCKLIANRPQDRADIWNLVVARSGSIDLQWIEAEWQLVGSLADEQVVELHHMIEKVRTGEAT